MRDWLRTLLTATFIGMATLLSLVAAPREARAQEPLEIVFVDVARRGSKSVYETIHDILVESDDVTITEQSKLWVAADRLGLDTEDFRASSKRERHRADFAKLMRELEVESIVLLDVYSRGRKAQLVFLGPDGTELADVKRSIRSASIDRSTALEMLKEGFGPLIPRITQWREEQAKLREARRQQRDAREEDPESGDGKEDVEQEGSDGEDGVLERGLVIEVGALLGRRSVDIETEAGFRLTHASPFLGVGLEVGALFVTFSEGTVGLGIRGSFGYAPFTTLFTDPETGAKLELGSSFLRTGGTLELRALVARGLQIGGYLGAEVMNVSVDQNPFYTGNQYVYARLGAAVDYALTERASVGVGAGLQPLFSAITSAGAYGGGSFALGFEASAGVSIELTEALFLGVRYRLGYLAPDYPEPDVLDDPASTRDVVHTGRVVLGIEL